MLENPKSPSTLVDLKTFPTSCSFKNFIKGMSLTNLALVKVYNVHLEIASILEK